MSPSSRRAWIEISKAAAAASATCVALLAEGVDRNSNGLRYPCDPEGSPSSRRAWIEIVLLKYPSRCSDVALLAEGVDRNIHRFTAGLLHNTVALLAEGVDRNSSSSMQNAVRPSRPPRGGRG